MWTILSVKLSSISGKSLPGIEDNTKMKTQNVITGKWYLMNFDWIKG